MKRVPGLGRGEGMTASYRNNSGCTFLCDSLLEKQNILHSQLQEESAGCDVKHHEGLDKSLGLYVPFVPKTGTGLRLYKNKLIEGTESAPRLHKWLGRRDGIIGTFLSFIFKTCYYKAAFLKKKGFGCTTRDVGS